MGGRMSYERLGGDSLEYYPCRYGGAKSIFRGPKKKLDKPFVAFVGGSDFYGRFIEEPMPELVAETTGLLTVNFGIMNAGVDAFLYDGALMTKLASAETTIVQVFAAHTMSNRFYKVHPRRNDRFLMPTELLRTLYQDVDFSDFHFVRHLLTALHLESPDKFRIVVEELQAAWTARMRLLISRLGGKKYLLHITDTSPRPHDADLGAEPLFVTQKMVEDLAKATNGVFTYDPTQTRAARGTEGMIFNDMQSEMAAMLLAAPCHQEMADLVSQEILKSR